MKLRNYLPVIAFCALAAGCNNSKSVQTSGIDLNNLDTTANAGVDFYQFACGGWMKNHPLTAEYSRLGTFDLLGENNRVQIQGLIEELSKKENEKGSIAQKIGDLYNVAMDSVKLNADGMAPIKAELERLAAIKDKKDIYTAIAQLQRNGVSHYFGLYVRADDMSSNDNLVCVSQGGLSLGERDYYLEQDSATTAVREAYKAHIAKSFQLAGMDEASAQKAMQAAYGIEEAIAKVSRSKAQRRDPHANYNKMSMDDVKKSTPTFEWDSYLKALGINEVSEMNVRQPEVIAEVAHIINTVPVEQQVAFLQWKLIRSASQYLSDDFVAEDFDFYGKTLQGKKELQPRWKRAVGTINGALGEAVGQMYVEKYFPAEAKQRMKELVANLQTALGQRIENLAWMSDATKAKAKEKLATFHVKVGYPDKWKDYSALDITNDSYWANIERSAQWEHARMLEKIGNPVDKDEWHMTPQTVNAYYNPTTNEICFPAGILQYPFFDMNADDAFNYGAIGVVIGHEMTHGFDDSGRQYDKDGNLKDWWTEEDAENFKQRAQVLIDFYNNIEVAPGVHGNGQVTLGENIADQGGLQVSFQAFRNATADAPLQNENGFTPEQRFFLAYANVWAGNIRPEEILRRTKQDEHSLGKWRVNGALPQVAAWYEAFGIDESSPMYVAPEKRVAIW